MGEMTDKQRGFISDIFGSGKHLLSLINDILDLSKVEAGKMMLDLEPVPLSSLFVEQPVDHPGESGGPAYPSEYRRGGRSGVDAGRPAQGQADRLQPALQRGEVHAARAAR